MANSKNFGIKDIARAAGVSVGTVDRVLHNRGKVSEIALKKVNEVLQKNEYRPNLIARTLGSNKNYKIVVLQPEPADDPYWSLVNQGIEQSMKEWIHYGVTISCCYFSLHRKSSFESVAVKALKLKPDAILLAPILYVETISFFQVLKEKQIPFALFNTNITETDALSFIGQDLYSSGRLAGELICLGQTGAGRFGVLHVDEDLNDSIHLVQKEKGFRDFIAGFYPFRHTVESLNRTSSTDSSFRKKLIQLLSQPDLKGIFVSSSRGTETAASILKSQDKGNIRLVGYDLLKKNIAYLKEGVIDFLIHQNPQQQAVEGINCLANHLIFKRVAKRVNLFPLEVITSQNLESYIQDQAEYTFTNSVI